MTDPSGEFVQFAIPLALVAILLALAIIAVNNPALLTTPVKIPSGNIDVDWERLFSREILALTACSMLPKLLTELKQQWDEDGRPIPWRRDDEDRGIKIWRATSTASNRIHFNWNPSRLDVDGLSGTKGGNPFWTQPEIWFKTAFDGRLPDPATDRIVAADKTILIASGFSVEDKRTTNDPWHVSIGGQTPGIIVRKGQPSWPGTASERRQFSEQLSSLFTEQVWP